MPQEKRLLVDVGMRNLPFPMKVASKQEPDGQATVGTVSVSAESPVNSRPTGSTRSFVSSTSIATISGPNSCVITSSIISKS